MARRLWISLSPDHVRDQLRLERQVGVAEPDRGGALACQGSLPRNGTPNSQL